MDRHLLIPGLEHIEAEPDWRRLRRVLLREIVPDRIPSMELIIDDEIVETALGRPISGFVDYVEFHLRMGYDTVSVRISPSFTKVYPLRRHLGGWFSVLPYRVGQVTW